MKKFSIVITLFIAAILTIPTGCKKEEPTQAETNAAAGGTAAARGAHARTYTAEVANDWVKLQLKLAATTPGIGNVFFCRHYAYSAIALYESVLPGMPSYQSLVGQLTDLPAMPTTSLTAEYHWASSANAALASITRKMFPTTSDANKTLINDLENSFNTTYSANTDAVIITRSVDFGKAVAQIVYDWAETDGYLHANDPYTAPVGPAFWAGPVASTPYWGNLRLLVSGSLNNSAPPAPLAYSEVEGSPFYNMVKEVYDASVALTDDQKAWALFWRDLPGVSTPLHYASMLEQVLENSNASLETAARAYALGGISVYDAAVGCWQIKYTYNLVRPITYIRNVLKITGWNPHLTTPAHPEYSSAHACISAANADAMESIFGANYAFTDHTYDYLGFTPRSFSSFRACGEDAANSRLYAGIHYQRSIDLSLVQGRTIAQNIISKLVLKKP